VVTISDVAAQAGVGAGTVSRVLNDSPSVSEPTRRRVLAAIELLDYRPNPLARGLSRGRAHTFGVVVPFFPQPSAVERMRGVIESLSGSHYDLVLFNVESTTERDQHFAELVRRDRADGLLVMSMPPPAVAVTSLLGHGVPVVLVDAAADGIPCVVTDDVEGGSIATRHLVSLGHQRIAFLGDDPDNPFGFTSSLYREQGFRQAMADAGLDVDERLVRHGPHDRTVGRRLGEQLLALRSRPTAVFAASDILALGVLEAARSAGLDVPEDLSVVGFDDIDVSSWIDLTTVHQPLVESGRMGARLLLDALSDRPPEPTQHRLPLQLVVRSTTGPAKRRTRRRADG
jgi:DNA-binding LacI/PurR family transcriptional regulator